MSTSPLPLPHSLTSRVFSPADLAAITGITTLQQRQWKMRRVVSFDESFHLPPGADQPYKRSEYTFLDAFRWFMLAALRDRGFDLLEASYFAGREPYFGFGLVDIHSDREHPIFALCRPTKDEPTSFANWTTFGGDLKISTAEAFWGDFGFWINLSEIQRRFIAAVEAL